MLHIVHYTWWGNRYLSKQETMWSRSLRESVGWHSKCVHVGFRKYVDNRKFLLHHSQMTNISKMPRENIYTLELYTFSKHARTLASLGVIQYVVFFFFFFRNHCFTSIAILRVTRHVFRTAGNTCLCLCTLPVPVNDLPPSVGSRWETLIQLTRC